MRRVLLVSGLALAASQAGHLIAYALRFGQASQQIQSTGVHAYFPLAAKTVLGLAAAVLLASLLAVAAARVVSAGARRRVAMGPSFFSLFAILFTVQLVLFVTQEIIEATAAGASADSVSGLVLWGMLGQLPAAAVAAATLRWLWSRVEGALDDLRSVIRAVRWSVGPPPLPLPVLQPADAAVNFHRLQRTRYARRGPPHSF